MSQPLRQNIDTTTSFFSKELTTIFNNIQTILIREYPVKEITSEYFLFSTLIDKETLLYKTISSFLQFSSINAIYDKLSPIISDSLITIVKPGREIPFSDELKYILISSKQIAQENGNGLITSDTVLLALLSHNSFIKKLFEEEGLTYEVAENESNSLHDTLKEVTKIKNDNNQGKQIQIQLINGNDGNDMTNIVQNIVNGNIFQKQNNNNGNIKNYCTNLTEDSELIKIDDLIGRKKEITTIANIMARRCNNNVAIVGESGVGKTQLVEGIAKKIAQFNCPPTLLNHIVYKLNLPNIMAGTSLRGMFEERVTSIIKEINSKNENVIVFIDDFHNFIGEKKKEEYDIGTLIKPLLSNKKVKIIITITPSGFKLMADSNKELTRKFQRVNLKAPTFEENKEILFGIKSLYENYHKVIYSDEAIISCIKTSERYISERSLPSSAIDILDEAGAYKKSERFLNEHIEEKQEEMFSLRMKKINALSNNSLTNEEISKLDNNIESLKKELITSLEKIRDDKNYYNITDNDIYNTISKHTGIDVNKLTNSDLQNLSNLNNILKEEIIGQDEAVDIVTKAIKRSKLGICHREKPLLSCLCIGSTGVGKTLLAKKIAKEVFGNEKNMIRFDMSEYADKTSVNKLIGSSAGYIGFDKGGLLTEAVRNKKHTVLLIDEIEKADPEIYNLFLQILDEGFLTDNIGNKVDFKNTIIILTSNVGAKKASLEKGLGFNVDNNINKKDIITKELKKNFPPEFINRLDEIVYFNALTENNLKKIITIEYNKIKNQFNEHNYILPNINEEIINYLYSIIEKDKDNGARPIIRTLQNEIEDKIIDIIIDNNKTDNIFNIQIVNDILIIT